MKALTYVWRDVNFLYGMDTDPELVTDITAINKAMYFMLRTIVGTEPMRRNFGSYLSYYLQQPVNEEFAGEVRASLISSLERWETRVSVNHNQTSVVPSADGLGYDITISYFVPSLQKPGVLSFVASRLD